MLLGKLLFHRHIQHAHHIQDIKGPFQLCDIINDAKAFMLSSSTPLKWMWVAQQIVSSFLKCYFEWPQDA